MPFGVAGRTGARAHAGRTGNRRTGARGAQATGAWARGAQGVRSAHDTGLGAPVHAWVCSARPGWVFCAL